MKIKLLFFSLVLFLYGCQTEKGFSPEEIQKIHTFSKKFVAEINQYNYEYIQGTWSEVLFRRRFNDTKGKEHGLINGFHEAYLKKSMKYLNNDVIKILEENDGRAFLTQVIIEEKEAIMYISTTFDKFIHFYKYKIGFINGKPMLSDFYDYPKGRWESEIIRTTMKLYFANDVSFENLTKSNQCSEYGDFEGAFNYLDKIPKTSVIYNTYSTMKVLYAQEKSDSVFSYTLNEAFQEGNNLYLRYIYNSYYFNRDSLINIFNQLEQEMPENHFVDSLETFEYYW